MINTAFLPVVRALHSKQCYQTLSAPRFGVMIHFDDSSSDESGLQWFADPRCKVSYNRLYFDSGAVYSIADDDHAAWHAGECLRKDANSSFYGLSATTNAKIPATKAQLDSMIGDTVRIFRFHKWPAADVGIRIQGHDEQAIFTKRNTPKRPDLWGKLGRKIDPTGTLKDRKIIDLTNFRIVVALQLGKMPASPPVAPEVARRPLLRRGAQGPAVEELQDLLGMRVSPGGRGHFGPATEATVKQFQVSHSLSADGIVGAMTWAALLRR